MRLKEGLRSETNVIFRETIIDPAYKMPQKGTEITREGEVFSRGAKGLWLLVETDLIWASIED